MSTKVVLDRSYVVIVPASVGVYYDEKGDAVRRVWLDEQLAALASVAGGFTLRGAVGGYVMGCSGVLVVEPVLEVEVLCSSLDESGCASVEGILRTVVQQLLSLGEESVLVRRDGVACVCFSRTDAEEFFGEESCLVE